MAQNSSDIELVMLTIDDYEEVVQLYGEQYLKRNPLAKVCKETTLKDQGESQVKDIKRTLDSGLSIGVRDKTTKVLVGLRLSAIFHVDKTSTCYVGDENEPSKTYRVLARYSPFGKEIKDLGVTTVLELYAVCVHKDYCRRGIAAMIIKVIVHVNISQLSN
ncbi:hypothetical protein Hamer_G001022 [Homarus americanus]|uniref:Uncharacterized protein n=1 Tax=Homarus americanus TaxID=6706 RepID=A0A8J5N2J7_HOMAM|nr:hypothetical protein Hamer_G001022 [Homarus americanus]